MAKNHFIAFLLIGTTTITLAACQPKTPSTQPEAESAAMNEETNAALQMEGNSLEEHKMLMDDGKTVMAMAGEISPNVMYAAPGQLMMLANHENTELKLVADDGTFESAIVQPGEDGPFRAPMLYGTYQYHSSANENITATLVVEKPKAVTDISYTDDGFSPDRTIVEAGTTVTFTNNSNGKMLVAEGSHTDHGLFEQETDSSKGESFEFTFSEPGSYSVHNHHMPTHTILVIVE